jgi:hypothetical protein
MRALAVCFVYVSACITNATWEAHILKGTATTRSCIFCGRTADSKEHLWPAWIHRRVRTRESVRTQIGKTPHAWTTNPEIKIKSVCTDCNNGWMSALENRSIPTLGSLVQDLTVPLDAAQQELISIWAVKTIMVLESADETRTLFYTAAERQNMMSNETIPAATSIPALTTIWIGRYFGNALHAGGTDFKIYPSDVIPEGGNGSVGTIIVGHLCIQVLTLRFSPKNGDGAVTVNPKKGRWDELLLCIWPATKSVTWPPALNFTNTGDFSIATLMDRWRIGKPAA